MLSISRPSVSVVEDYLRTQADLPFSYNEHGQSRTGRPPGYDVDENAVELGRGAAIFDAARAALRRWAMFPAQWAYIHPVTATIEPGTVVAMTARVAGLWWRNACRIVYVIDEPRRFGFAYGTLPGHVEAGEELFLVELDDDDRVWYRIRAFSRPRHWAARLGYRLARAYQRRFVRDSKQAMVEACRHAAV
jgi:uncharacterized protein (UPF0548 family)